MNNNLFSKIYEQFNAMVLRRCLYILKNEEAALDAMQEVFIKVLSGKNPVFVSNWGGYLFTAATNICLNVIRKERKVLVNSDIMPLLQGKENVEGEIMDKIALAEFERGLDKRNKLIMVLRFKHRHKLEEISEVIGISVSAIKKRLRKVRETALSIKEKYYE